MYKTKNKTKKKQQQKTNKKHEKVPPPPKKTMKHKAKTDTFKKMKRHTPTPSKK